MAQFSNFMLSTLIEQFKDKNSRSHHGHHAVFQHAVAVRSGVTCCVRNNCVFTWIINSSKRIFGIIGRRRLIPLSE